jgi:hypothetical protein
MITRLFVDPPELSLPDNRRQELPAFGRRIGRPTKPLRLWVFLLILLCAPLAPVTPSLADTDIVHKDDPCNVPKQEHAQTIAQFVDNKAFNLVYTYVCEYIGVDPIGDQESRWTLEKLVRDPPDEDCPPPTGECPLSYMGADEQ